ncbi:hypothetical protein M1D47_21395 [Bacillus sp. R1-10]
MHNALLRECMEEVGEEVEIGELLHIREYIGKNHEHFHSIFMFTKLNTIFFATGKGKKIKRLPIQIVTK